MTAGPTGTVRFQSPLRVQCTRFPQEARGQGARGKGLPGGRVEAPPPASALSSPGPLPGPFPVPGPGRPQARKNWRGGGERQEVAAPAPPLPHPGKSQGLASHFVPNTSSLKSRGEGLRRWEVPGDGVGRGETGKLLRAGRGRDRSVQGLPGARSSARAPRGLRAPGSGWHLWGALLNRGPRGVTRGAELCSSGREGRPEGLCLFCSVERVWPP